MKKKTIGTEDCHKTLRSLIAGPNLSFLMEAHNALSAKIAAEAGFQALWASSLTISASMGLRDANELTWSETLSLVAAMVDSVDIPVLLDADSGYGDFNILRRFVHRACDCGVAGICLEDKLFPKINSFAETEQRLANIAEFSGMISTAKESQKNSEFIIVARTEALVVGAGLKEALKRANSYVDAGADAILVQSKSQDADEILAFANHWNRDIPLIAVPTTYPNFPVDQLYKAGIGNIIWANQSLRACVAAMRKVTQTLFSDQSAKNVETNIASIADVFDLTEMDELLATSKKLKVKR